MKFKKTITIEPITGAVHTIPYKCLNDGFIQIMVRCESDKVEDKTIKIMEEDYTTDLIKGVKDWSKACDDYVKSLPEYSGSEDILDIVE